jgi:tetratricopeptide (TPR) repeat protein
LVDNIRAADFQTRNLRFSLASGEPYRVARALAMEAAFRATAGSRSEQSAKRLSDIATKLAERLDNRHATGLTTLIAGLLHYLVGRWQNASELLGRAEESMLEEPGAIWELHAAQRFRLNALTYLGDVGAIASVVPDLVKGARERGNLYAECYLRVRLCCMLSLAKDDPDTAIKETEDVMGRWSQGGFHLQHYNELFALASTALYQGRAAEALQRVRSTWPRLEGSLMLRTQAIRVEALILRARACLSYLQQVGLDRPVRKTLERDIRTLSAEGVPWASAFSKFAQGLYHAASGEPEPARHWLGIAERELAAGDMRLFAAATRWRLGQLEGGDTGQSMIWEARRTLQAQQITNPERFLQHYAPGF